MTQTPSVPALGVTSRAGASSSRSVASSYGVHTPGKVVVWMRKPLQRQDFEMRRPWGYEKDNTHCHNAHHNMFGVLPGQSMILVHDSTLYARNSSFHLPPREESLGPWGHIRRRLSHTAAGTGSCASCTARFRSIGSGFLHSFSGRHMHQNMPDGTASGLMPLTRAASGGRRRSYQTDRHFEKICPYSIDTYTCPFHIALGPFCVGIQRAHTDTGYR